MLLATQGLAWARPDSTAPGLAAREQVSEAPITNQWCPVLTDEPVEPDIYTEYRGERVFLCCQKCLKQFLADPESYASNVPALAAQSSVEPHEHAEAEDSHAQEDEHATGGAEPHMAGEEHDHSDHGGAEGDDSPELLPWLGRFHPMLVHFPIALLLAAAVAEALAMLTGASGLAAAARFCLWGGALGALVAAPLGWANAAAVADSYVGFSVELLLYHRWIGIGTAVSAGLALGASIRARRAGDPTWTRTYRVLLFLSALLVSIAGHLGGSLIYGWEYLNL